MKIVHIDACQDCIFASGHTNYKTPQSTGTTVGKVSGITYTCAKTGCGLGYMNTVHKSCPLPDTDGIKQTLTQLHNYAYQLGQYFPDTEKYYSKEELNILSDAMRKKIQKIIGGE